MPLDPFSTTGEPAAPQDEDPLLGFAMPAQVADRYRVDHAVGRGGMSVIYRATDELLGDAVALKVLRPDLIGSAAIRQRLAAEAVTMVLLDHPHVLHVRDMGTEASLAYVVSDWAPGGSARLHVRRCGPVDVATAARWGVELCSALDAAHLRGIVHRDLKPGNVLIGADGRALLADFGVARVPDADVDTESGLVLGTVSTMAPEQRRDPTRADGRADLYGLGATLFHLLTLDNPVDLFLAVGDEDRFEAVPDTIRDVLVRATRASPDDRYPDARAMALDLAPLVNEQVWADEPWLRTWLDGVRPASSGSGPVDR